MKVLLTGGSGNLGRTLHRVVNAVWSDLDPIELARAVGSRAEVLTELEHLHATDESRGLSQ